MRHCRDHKVRPMLHDWSKKVNASANSTTNKIEQVAASQESFDQTSEDQAKARMSKEQAAFVAAAIEKSELEAMGDEHLMRAIAASNTRAFEELYDRYVRGCFGLAMKIVRDPSIAEEVVQDVFMKLWSNPLIFSPERGKFSGWLLTLVHNRSVDKLRRLKTNSGRLVLPLEGEGEGAASLADLLPDGRPGPYEEAWSSEKGQIVREALNTLPKAQRETLVLAYFGGLTQKEIAEKLDEPLGTVKTRTRSALQQLRRTLVGQGLLGELL